MIIVSDSSVVVAALVDTGISGAWAESILAQRELFAPEILQVEVTNVLRRLERGREITPADAQDAPLATLDDRLAKSPGPRCRILTPTSAGMTR